MIFLSAFVTGAKWRADHLFCSVVECEEAGRRIGFVFCEALRRVDGLEEGEDIDPEKAVSEIFALLDEKGLM